MKVTATSAVATASGAIDASVLRGSANGANELPHLRHYLATVIIRVP